MSEGDRDLRPDQNLQELFSDRDTSCLKQQIVSVCNPAFHQLPDVSRICFLLYPRMPPSDREMEIHHPTPMFSFPVIQTYPSHQYIDRSPYTGQKCL